METYNSRLEGYECMTALEVIEHLDPHVLSRFGVVTMGTYRPRLLLVTTPVSGVGHSFSSGKRTTGEIVGEWHVDAAFAVDAWGSSSSAAYCVRICHASVNMALVVITHCRPPSQFILGIQLWKHPLTHRTSISTLNSPVHMITSMLQRVLLIQQGELGVYSGGLPQA
jgi:hypothetical protein